MSSLLEHRFSWSLHADLKELLQVLPLFVSVTGKAWASKPLECDLADQQAVLVEVMLSAALF